MPVCIAGMHRSGTSAVTKLLVESGLYLGPERDIMPAAEENPEGFWEHLGFVALNEEILNQLGGGWDCPPPEPEDWAGGVLAPLRPRAEALVAPFAGREPWGWKDPRNSLTLPFWREIVGPLRLVFVMRNPLEVAFSLRKRNGFSLALGLTLWHVNTRRLLDAVAAADRILTHYDAYFSHPEAELRRVAAFLDLPFDPEVVERFRGGRSPGLRHHRSTLGDLVDSDAAPEIVELYEVVCDEAGWDEPEPTGSARAARGRLGRLAAGEVLTLGVGRSNRAHVAALRDVEELRRTLVHREARIDELDVALQAQRAEFARVTARLAEVEKLEVAAEREVTALRQTVGDQAAHLDVMAIQLDALFHHEQELRTQLVSSHEQLAYHDGEVMGLLGAVLARHAPGAPAAIYYRHLLQKVKELVAAHLPPATPVAVIAAGDDLMLELDGRLAYHFPPEDPSRGPNLAPIDNAAAISQLELLRTRGAEFLVVPGSAQSWLVRYPEFVRYVEQRYPTVVKEVGTCVVYALSGDGGQGSGLRN